MASWMVVFRKEFKEIFRDSRTTFNIIISPLLITPLLFAIIGVAVQGQVKKAEKETIPVAIVGLAKSPTLQENLKGVPNIEWKEKSRAEAEEAIRKRDIRAAVVIPEDAEQRLAENRTVTLSLLVDEGSQSSMQAGQRLETVIVERGQRVVAQRLIEQGLSSELATPLQIKQQPVTGGGSAATLILTSILPYVLAVSAIMGGVSAANDSVAGEKERGTLETLLVSPASRRDLVLGKFLAVAGVSLVSSLLSVIGLLWPFFVPLKVFEWMTRGGLTLSPTAIVTMILVQIPLAVLGAGLLLTISTYAKNQKEAQTYLAPVLLVTTVAAMMSMFLKMDSGIIYSAVPILNAALTLKGALEGTLNPVFVAVASVTSFVYAGLAVAISAYLFQKEEVLLKA
jgi:sodium transport system permease protein